MITKSAAEPAIAVEDRSLDSEILDWMARQDLDDLVFGLVKDAPHDGQYVVNAGSGPCYGATLRDALRAAMAPGVAATAVDRGPWIAQRWSDGRVVLQSDDFTHDVALIVDGDFADDEQRMRYAQRLASQFNGGVEVSALTQQLRALVQQYNSPLSRTIHREAGEFYAAVAAIASSVTALTPTLPKVARDHIVDLRKTADTLLAKFPAMEATALEFRRAAHELEGALLADGQALGCSRSLVDALKRISARCPADSADYTLASIGDTARNALAAAGVTAD